MWWWLIGLAGAADFEEVRSIWSMEVGATFAVRGDLTGNVRDIPRAYAAGEVAGDLPLGGGFFFRSILRAPLGTWSPSLLLGMQYDAAASGGEFEDYGRYERRASGLGVSAGLGACGPVTCIFANYHHRTLRTADDNYPITNVEAVLGNPEEATVDPFTPPYIGRTISDVVITFIESVDFGAQRISVDLSDVVTMHGAEIAFVGGLSRRISYEGALGGHVVRQRHTTVARVVRDVSVDEPVDPFDYTYDKSLAAMSLELGFSVGLLPERMPVQLALGIRGSMITLVDLSVDRTLGGYVTGGPYLSSRW